ncbi:MAG: UDP-N-acetylglucosamine--N-acetylmuramyl-(pentapeptide) pyrophosphoryl-undecaprenol N-acetylglucosamine transferase, partial [bacterium]
YSCSILGLAAFIISNFIGFSQSLTYCITNRPKLMLNMGGYAGFPAAVAAYILGIPIIIHEANAMPGKSAKLLAHYSKIVTVSFPDDAHVFRDKAKFIGNPIRPSIGKVSKEEAVKRLGLRSDAFTISVMGGSQGALNLNTMIPELAKKLSGTVQIIHLTGERDHERIMKTVADMKLDHYKVISYLDDPSSIYAASDLIISRSGAGAVTEIAACGIPAIFIPYPYAADNHQQINASYFSDQSAAITIKENELSVDNIYSIILSFIDSPHLLQDMRRKMSKLGNIDAAAKLADIIDKELLH